MAKKIKIKLSSKEIHSLTCILDDCNALFESSKGTKKDIKRIKKAIDLALLKPFSKDDKIKN